MEDKTNKECCEKCYSTYTEHDYPAHTTYDACINQICPCHQQPEQTLSKEQIKKMLGEHSVIDYEKGHSHYHCWHQNQPPACGIKLEDHKQCCLCPTEYPEPSREEDYPKDRTPAYGITLFQAYNKGREDERKDLMEGIKKMWNYPCNCAYKQIECKHDYNLMLSIINLINKKK